MTDTTCPWPDKNRYGSEHAAKDVIKAFRSPYGRMQAYPCGGHWHIGHGTRTHSTPKSRPAAEETVNQTIPCPTCAAYDADRGDRIRTEISKNLTGEAAAQKWRDFLAGFHDRHLEQSRENRRIPGRFVALLAASRDLDTQVSR